MILAHLPAGYVLNHGLRARLAGKYLFPAVMLGAVFPDFDMIWFYLIDDRAFHHHRYWVHIPLFWACLGAVILPLLAMLWRAALAAATGFLIAVFLHLALDSIAGDILWGWPWSDQFFSLITVPAKYSHWVLNFLLHPVALGEAAIILAAALLFRRKCKAKTP